MLGGNLDKLSGFKCVVDLIAYFLCNTALSYLKDGIKILRESTKICSLLTVYHISLPLILLKQSACKLLGVEGLHIINLLTNTNEFNRDSKLLLNRDDNTALCSSVKLGKNKTCDL